MNAPEDRLGVKLGHRRCTTTLPPKAEVHPRSCYVAKVPAAVRNRSKTVASFDHLIGGNEQFVWHGEAEHPGRLSVDDKLELRGGTLYLAHFAGGAGAVAILSAMENADAALVMATADTTGRTKREKIINANPFLERFTVADLRNWAVRKMQVPGL